MTQLTSWVHRYTLRDLLDDSFDLLKERVITLLVAGALPYILLVAYMALIRLYVLPQNFIRDFSDIPNLLENGDFWLYFCGLFLISSIAFALSLLAQSRVAIAHTLGETVSLRNVYRAAFVPTLRLLGLFVIYYLFSSVAITIAAIVAGIITGLIAALGAAVGVASGSPEFSIVIGVVAILGWYFVLMLAMMLISVLFIAAPVFVAYERCGVFAALSKSFRFASMNYKANVVALFALAHVPLLFMLLAVAVQALLMYGLRFIAPTVGEVIGSTIAILISSLGFSAIIACQSALTYLDGKSRLEALDLRLMAQEMGLEEEIEQVFRAKTPQSMANFPVYTSMPQAPGAAVTNYLTHPVANQHGSSLPTQAAPGFPNYAAPPPLFATDVIAAEDTPCESAVLTTPGIPEEQAPEPMITAADVPSIAEAADAE